MPLDKDYEKMMILFTSHVIFFLSFKAGQSFLLLRNNDVKVGCISNCRYL